MQKGSQRVETDLILEIIEIIPLIYLQFLIEFCFIFLMVCKLKFRLI
jgi:hypothetical protein